MWAECPFGRGNGGLLVTFIKATAIAPGLVPLPTAQTAVDRHGVRMAVIHSRQAPGRLYAPGLLLYWLLVGTGSGGPSCGSAMHTLWLLRNLKRQQIYPQTNYHR